MKSLRDLLPEAIPLPAPTALRHRLSQDPADKTWECATCGIVAPFVFSDGWYSRRPCACERLAAHQRALEAMRREALRERAAYTYTWLSRGWSEEALAKNTFATFQRERQPVAYDLAWAFAGQPQGVLALYGSYGTGKTHLLAAVANQLGARGTACLFASVVTLFDAVQERIQRNQDYHELLRHAIATPLLLLDDLDKLKPSEFREELLYKLVNGRLPAGRPLAISSNCTPGELERWVGKATRSRLMQGLVPVQMSGADYRLGGQG